MKYKLNLAVLQPGDIILVGYNDDNGREIQRRTQSDYSHVMLYWYDSIIHAADIVITENPMRQIFDEDEKVCILRLKDEFHQPLRIFDLINYARSFVGTFYDNKALIAMKKGKIPNPKENRQMCAKFVAQCFEYVCADLVDDYETCTPRDILMSSMLYPVENPTVIATDSDIEYAEDYEHDVTLIQSYSIKYILLSLKRAFPETDIVTFNQIDEYILNSPKDSDTVLKIFTENGYFELINKEKEYNSFLYDATQFQDRFGDDSISCAFSVKKGNERIITEQENNIIEFKKRMQFVGELEYYKRMIDLRERIIANAKERTSVADEVLLRNNIVKIPYPWIND